MLVQLRKNGMLFLRVQRTCRNKYDENAKWKVKKAVASNQNKSKVNIIKCDDASDELLFLVGRVNGWIIDSGAICHVSCKRENFIEFDGAKRYP